MQAETINQWIEAGLQAQVVTVSGDGSHFTAFSGERICR